MTSGAKESTGVLAAAAAGQPTPEATTGENAPPGTSSRSQQSNQANRITVVELRARCVLEGSPPLAVLQAFMKAVEARLWFVYCGNYTHSGKKGIAPDIGLDRIYVDAGKLYVRETVPEHFQMLYCGSVSRTPSMTALFLCSMFGDTF